VQERPACGERALSRRCFSNGGAAASEARRGGLDGPWKQDVAEIRPREGRAAARRCPDRVNAAAPSGSAGQVDHSRLGGKRSEGRCSRSTAQGSAGVGGAHRRAVEKLQLRVSSRLTQAAASHARRGQERTRGYGHATAARRQTERKGHSSRHTRARPSPRPPRCAFQAKSNSAPRG